VVVRGGRVVVFVAAVEVFAVAIVVAVGCVWP
jgi:hypothetical protein